MSLGCVSTQKWCKFSSDRTTDAPIARAMDEVTFLRPNAPSLCRAARVHLRDERKWVVEIDGDEVDLVHCTSS